MTVDGHTLRMGMVGGGRDAFIGAVHRTASRLDGRMTLIAGALSSTREKALASGQDLGLPAGRNYGTWTEMLDAERKLPLGERIDFVSIVTPNHVHFPAAKAFVDAGFHVVCDKPLVHTSAQARELTEAVRKAGTVFAVTYNYSGYPLVKQARAMVGAGEIGAVRKVIVEYNQGWLAGALEKTGQKQADWRTDPARAGFSGAIGDIGSHAEQLVSYVTGLELSAICADLTSFVPGRRLDDDANLLLKFVPRDSVEAKGVLISSQIEIGHENDLRLRVFGTTGTLDWRQENPNELIHRPEGQPERVYRRGNAYLCDAAKQSTRLPAGHPEAFYEAFANVYRAAGDAMRATAASASSAPRAAGAPARNDPAALVRTLTRGFDFPTVIDGARGVHFIEKTVESSASDRKWTPARFEA